MFKIGEIEIKGKVVLAPMAGYTFLSYRNFMNPFGVSLCFTEMVSDMGLIYGNKETFAYIDFPKSDVPTGVQLFGHNPDSIAQAAKICLEYNPNIDFFDVNMGCPVNKITSAGAGSSLMKNPAKCGEIVRKIKEITNKPVTAKIRLGWDKKSINYLEVIDELEKAGVDLISIHARTRSELYLGEPNFEEIRDLRLKMHVPLLVSGNIFTVEDALKALEITKADGVMVARGGVGNPLLITNINHALNNEELEETTFEKQKEYCLTLVKAVIEEKGEYSGIRIFRSMASKFFFNLPQIKKLRNRLSSEIVTYDDIVRIINEYKEENNL